MIFYKIEKNLGADRRWIRESTGPRAGRRPTARDDGGNRSNERGLALTVRREHRPGALIRTPVEPVWCAASSNGPGALPSLRYRRAGAVNWVRKNAREPGHPERDSPSPRDQAVCWWSPTTETQRSAVGAEMSDASVVRLGPLPGRSWHGAMVAFRSLHTGEVDAFQEHHEVGRPHLHSRPGAGGSWKAKRAGFESLDPGIAIPSFLVRYMIFARPGCCCSESSAPLAIGRDGTWG